ncbi:chaperonin 10-like protein [Zopfochytrium polystomum]|nr:chaperonin 10-like protein [Zopfochytrium polystomum]
MSAASTASIPTANKALVAEAIRGDQVVRDFPHSPATLADNEVVVKVLSAGLNPVDWKIVKYGVFVPAEAYPQVFGSDGAGVIEAVGAKVTSHKPGDRVFFQGKVGDRRTSSFQEFAVLNEAFVYPLPDKVSFDEGATFGVAGITAAVSLFVHLKAPKWWAGEPAVDGTFLLVWGGATAVGHAAIQLARRAGFTVITTASPAHHDHLKSLGASHTFDYRSPTVVADILALTAANPLTHAIDTAGAASPETLFSTLSPTLPATLVLVASNSTADFDAALKAGDAPNRRYAQAWGSSWVFPDLAKEFWKAFVALVEEGKYRTQKLTVAEGGLAGIVAAQKLQMEGKVSGFKYVVRVQE